ncbi:dihydropteroate synthase [Guyparkeria hydrothermalis]|uniref:dihydropteroate synthase n=2 Tax=Guyparkeria TaxID=2035712 RepID=UPI0020209B3A|nr:dihydropteroate synthase [Guyparkeria hydrothermalis]MCL7750447.1 dihydropteroate synthase [Guyparkeria hydrothermalis]
MNAPRACPDWRQTGRPLIMGILNATPDSFSDGGRFNSVDRALAAAEAMLEAGADLLDIGGESTRPGATPVTQDEELARVIPVIEALAARFDCPLSVDTSTPSVMTRAVEAGACLINDVRALTRPGAVEAAAASGASVCVMHMRGEPGDMATWTDYRDVVTDVIDYLADRLRLLREAGVPAERLLVDPGFGFAKTHEQNFELLRRLGELARLDAPVLVGMSRKRMIGEATGQPVDRRAVGSAAAALLAAERGAAVIRVHDVEATRDALAVWAATSQA